MPEFRALQAEYLLVRYALPTIERIVCSIQPGSMLDLGPVFLPQSHRLPPPFPVKKNREPRSEQVAVSCFSLSRFSEKKLAELFQHIWENSSHAVFLDFKQPERNIEIPIAFLLQPLKKFLSKNGIPFKNSGGMEGILYREQSRFSIMSRHTLLAGALCCILVRCRQPALAKVQTGSRCQEKT